MVFICDNQKDRPTMPTPKSQARLLHCPFCSSTSTRGTGLSSHIRSQHPREYTKWNKNPKKLLDAAKQPEPEHSGKAPKAKRILSPAAKPASEVTQRSREEARSADSALVDAVPAHTPAGDDARRLVEQAHEQLKVRKQMVEAELARIESLRAEYESVTARVAALDEAIKAFQESDQRQRS
jgi:hypothetical protein